MRIEIVKHPVRDFNFGIYAAILNVFLEANESPYQISVTYMHGSGRSVFGNDAAIKAAFDTIDRLIDAFVKELEITPPKHQDTKFVPYRWQNPSLRSKKVRKSEKKGKK